MNALINTWDSWMRMSTSFWSNLIEANTKTLKLASPDCSKTNGHRTLSPDYAEADWRFERSVHEPDKIEVGDYVLFTKQIQEDDVQQFARSSGDTNPLHLDNQFASNTRFGQRIVHGTLVSGVISAALARLPGEIIYLSHNTKFLKPVFLGETITAKTEVVEQIGDDRFRLTTFVENEKGERVAEGEDIVLIDELPMEQESLKERWLSTESISS